MISTERPVDEIGDNVGAYLFTNTLNYLKQSLKPYMPKVGHGLIVLDPTIYHTSKLV